MEKKQSIEKLSELAKLNAVQNELIDDIAEIIKSFESLKNVEFQKREPILNGTRMEDDLPKPSLSIEEVMANAPNHYGPFFVVPTMIGKD